MIAAILIALLVLAVGAITWATRKWPRKPRCCNPGQWPPDDITSGKV